MAYTVKTIIFLLIVVFPPAAYSFWSDAVDMKVSFEIVDSEDASIPHVTVLGYLSPIKGPLQLAQKDLRFVVDRYFGSHEFMLPARANHVLPKIIVFPMTNKDGVIDIEIDYQDYEGAAAKTPDELIMGFAFLKHGYKPETVSFEQAKSRSFSKKIVFQKADDFQRYATSQEEEFNVLRFELSGPDKNVRMTTDNLKRIKGIKKKLVLLAESSNVKLAARINARLQYMPSITIRNGNIVGFKRSDPYTKESLEYLKNAYVLDPSNPYIAAKHLFSLGSEFGGGRYDPNTANTETKERFNKFFNKLKNLIESSGPKIWPQYHALYANWHRKLDHKSAREEGKALLDALYRTTPKYKTREKLFWLLNNY